MKWLMIVAALVTAGCAHAHAQFLHQDECIDPTMESMAFVAIPGHITGVREDALIIDERIVHLAGVELDPAARTFLEQQIGREAVVAVSTSHMNECEVWGEVDIGRVELNLVLLERGLARYTEAPWYSISDYSECLYRIAEREARASRAGIWSR